jgi:hypothetical protein
MDPESITISQLISSFTAKHWFRVVTVITSVLGVAGGGGYWVGKSLAESQGAVLLAELKGSLAKVEAQLEVTRSQKEQHALQMEQCKSERQQWQSEVIQQQKKVATLTEKLGRENNCTFIHEQIVETQKLVEHPDGLRVFGDEEWEKKERERVAALTRRLEGYQQQLSTCNKS